MPLARGADFLTAAAPGERTVRSPPLQDIRARDPPNIHCRPDLAVRCGGLQCRELPSFTRPVRGSQTWLRVRVPEKAAYLRSGTAQAGMDVGAETELHGDLRGRERSPFQQAIKL
jgi:hypothetical protein